MNNVKVSVYIICGILTTLVNIVVYYILTKWFGINYLISNAAAWIVAVVFAYITNSLFVFDKSINKLWDKFPHFIFSRMISGMLDMILLFLIVTIMNVDDKIAKLLVVTIIFIINYLVSKFIIFT